MKRLLVFITVLTISFSQLNLVRAFETDQYNLPPKPLSDIGDEVAEYTAENIEAAMLKLNQEIEEERNLVSRNDESSRSREKKSTGRLAYLQSEDAVAREVFKRLGYGFIAFSKAGTWMDSHRFRAQPARYKASYRRSIYSSLPTNYFTLSPTVNLYGTSLGTDKIAHFYQQGYTYYRIYRRARAKGLSDREAVTKAISWGRMTEHTYYGTLVGGVFSNADLAANYAGMKFYEGLTKPLTLNGAVRPPLLKLKDGIWTLNAIPTSEGKLLKPFISDHLNEALNPSVLAPGLRSAVRGKVRKQSCPQWIEQFPGATKSDWAKASAGLSLWNGEAYGHRSSKKLVTIANTCFAAESPDQ